MENKIRQIITDKLGYEEDEINKTSLLKDDLGIDSFDSLRIIFAVEDEFDIQVPPSEVAWIKTVNDMVEYILNRLYQQRTA
ncbi:MAG: acyl carrier protein [Nitrospiraceae bacterium]|nr:MAG: acyl carrier protein [Nitrospiraceae bacterium]